MQQTITLSSEPRTELSARCERLCSDGGQSAHYCSSDLSHQHQHQLLSNHKSKKCGVLEETQAFFFFTLDIPPIPLLLQPAQSPLPLAACSSAQQLLKMFSYIFSYIKLHILYMHINFRLEISVLKQEGRSGSWSSHLFLILQHKL